MQATPLFTVPCYNLLTIRELGRIIYKDWRKPAPAAQPYLAAMYDLEKITDNYGADSGKSIVLYFLNNATSWKGDVARAVKAELRKRTK